jgi:hypothetical protein
MIYWIFYSFGGHVKSKKREFLFFGFFEKGLVGCAGLGLSRFFLKKNLEREILTVWKGKF